MEGLYTLLCEDPPINLVGFMCLSSSFKAFLTTTLYTTKDILLFCVFFHNTNRGLKCPIHNSLITPIGNLSRSSLSSFDGRLALSVSLLDNSPLPLPHVIPSHCFAAPLRSYIITIIASFPKRVAIMQCNVKFKSHGSENQNHRT